VTAFRTEVSDGVAVLTLDVPGRPVNTFTRAVREEFAALVRRLRVDGAVHAVILVSGKPDTFVAGADIEEFVALRDAAEARALSSEGQRLLEGVAGSPKPFVIAIHGVCLGGGLELALACHYRIATNDPRTRLGLPEVRLGLVPGAGGCVRLPRTVGQRAALEMILSGRDVSATKALLIGLVDEVVPAPILRDVAIEVARRLVRQGIAPRRGRGGVTGWLLDRTSLGRALVRRRARTRTLEMTGGHYPAPLAALEAVRFGLAEGTERGLEREAETFGEMAVTDVSRRLVEVFFATTALKKDPGVPPPGADAVPVRHVGVVGAGFMGSGIAATAASRAGLSVRMRDTDLAAVGRGLSAVASIVRERERRGSATRLETERDIALVTGSADYTGFRRAELVFEAVTEDVVVKQAVLREVEGVTRPECVFASNTSTIPIGRIAEASRHAETVIGMHFLSPASRMPLLEVVPTARTAPVTVATAVALGRRLGKTVIVVRDSPGFFVNRILAPYLNEAGRLLFEGAPVEALDRALTEWGFPVGPLALLDEVGLDVAVKAGGVMHEALGDRLAPAADLTVLVRAGRIGRKSGRGLYRYERGRRGKPDPDVHSALGAAPSRPMPRPLLVERLVFAMLNEAVLALGEGVIRSPRDGDVGAILGLAFPPFRGGPFRAMDAMGLDHAVSILERLAGDYGDHFAPAPLLADLARRGGRFYPTGS